MSYDIRICVKVEGCNIYTAVSAPKYDSPTYNLRDMFVNCMDWNYSQGEYYPADFVLSKVTKGIFELTNHSEKYEKFNPSNGWGSLEGALRCLKSVRECILETSEEYPIGCLYFEW